MAQLIIKSISVLKFQKKEDINPMFSLHFANFIALVKKCEPGSKMSQLLRVMVCV